MPTHPDAIELRRILEELLALVHSGDKFAWHVGAVIDAAYETTIPELNVDPSGISSERVDLHPLPLRVAEKYLTLVEVTKNPMALVPPGSWAQIEPAMQRILAVIQREILERGLPLARPCSPESE